MHISSVTIQVIKCIVYCMLYSGHVIEMYDSNSISHEAKCLRRSVEMNHLFYSYHNLPFNKFGGIIVAMTKLEVQVHDLSSTPVSLWQKPVWNSFLKI